MLQKNTQQRMCLIGMPVKRTIIKEGSRVLDLPGNQPDGAQLAIRFSRFRVVGPKGGQPNLERALPRTASRFVRAAPFILLLAEHNTLASA
jgi:hypothetical protein